MSDRVFRVDRLGPIRVTEGDTRVDDDGTTWARIDSQTGHLHGRARIARTGVQVYSDGQRQWGEYRDESEVFAPEAMDSFKRIVMTDGHPSQFVDAKNARKLTIGHLGDDLRRDGIWLTAPFTITDGEMIQKIRDGKAELSMGYWQLPVKDSGVFDGKSYEFKQTALRGNHQAVVDKARAGGEARIPAFDGHARPVDGTGRTISVAISVTHEDSTMTQPKGEQPDPKPTAKAKQDGAPAPAKPEPAPTADAATLARLDALEAENAALKKQRDEDRKAESARIDARVALVQTAKACVPALDCTGKTDAEVRRAVLDKIAPDLAPKLDARADVPGYLEASFDHVVERFMADKADTAASFAGFTRAAERKQDGDGDSIRKATADAAYTFAARTLGHELSN